MSAYSLGKQCDAESIDRDYWTQWLDRLHFCGHTKGILVYLERSEANRSHIWIDRPFYQGKVHARYLFDSLEKLNAAAHVPCDDCLAGLEGCFLNTIAVKNGGWERMKKVAGCLLVHN